MAIRVDRFSQFTTWLLASKPVVFMLRAWQRLRLALFRQAHQLITVRSIPELPEQNSPLVLSERDSKLFYAALENPPKPSARLQSLFQPKG